MKIKENCEELEAPQGVTLSVTESVLKVKGPKGEVERSFTHPKIKVTVENNKVKILGTLVSRREKAIIGSFKAHIKNMFKGAVNGHVYKLKICSGHFPMNVSVKGNEISVKNLFGEKIPRVLKFDEKTKVKIEGDLVIVEGIFKESVSQTAANIEKLCRITNRDRRIFQDGIYIIDKDGKEIKAN